MCKNEVKKRPKEYLFVYGTLLSNIASRVEHIMRKQTKVIGEGYVHGKIYDLGEYPAAIADPDSKDLIYGELIELQNKKILDILDDYEECGPQWPEPTEYIRIKVKVHITSSILIDSSIEAFFYNYNFPVLEIDQIKSGSYKKFVQEQKKPYNRTL